MTFYIFLNVISHYLRFTLLPTILVVTTLLNTVTSIPIPGGRSLRPVKNGGSSDKVVGLDQNFSLIFHWAYYILTKCSPYFHSPYINISLANYTLNKTPHIFYFPPIFNLHSKQTPPIFHWANYIVNKAPSIFYFPLFFHFLLNNSPPYFYFPILQSTPLTKLSPSRRKKAKMGGKT